MSDELGECGPQLCDLAGEVQVSPRYRHCKIMDVAPTEGRRHIHVQRRQGRCRRFRSIDCPSAPLKKRHPFVSGAAGRDFVHVHLGGFLGIRGPVSVARSRRDPEGWMARDADEGKVVPGFGTTVGSLAMALSASEARKRLFPLIEQVNDDEEAVEIVSKSGTAFLVPEQLWRSLVETRYLLRSPANARRLLDSVARVEAGEFQRHDLISDAEETERRVS
ncbi:type II toxin-antitoxin system Phd/YefM family antitoxin [Actinoplanes sp. NPDC049599]|uniref:type II toxin-antitoxin system Phd/YefM family antitoxin n=2 Tax=unclassified Actinoplanes TaxID=2626549 RepID=UPI0037A7F7AF